MLYVYIGCLAFAVAYAALSTVFSVHGFDHGVDHGGGAPGHANADHADMPSPFNPLVIASAIATFGTVGLIGKLGFGMGDFFSAVLSLCCAGAIGAGIFFGVVRLMYSSQSDSTFSVNDLVGMEAEVITPIPVKGMGEVACTMNGQRINLPAQSGSGKGAARGEIVRINGISGNTAVVTPKLTLDDIDLERLDERPEREQNNKQTL